MNDSKNALLLQPEGLNPRYDLLLRAVEECVEAYGLAGVTIDGVAAVAGSSVATLYRKFGSRDGMLRAFLARRSLNMVATGHRIAVGRGSLGERLEGILTFMVHGVNNTSWVKREHLEGLTSTGARLMHDTATLFFQQVVEPMLEQAAAQGHWKCPAPIEELGTWLVDEYSVLVRLRAHDEAEVRRHIRTYILPVLGLSVTGPGENKTLSDRLDALQREVATLSDLLRSLCRKLDSAATE
jgi:AcrR family transcriptional regulator